MGALPAGFLPGKAMFATLSGRSSRARGCLEIECLLERTMRPQADKRFSQSGGGVPRAANMATWPRRPFSAIQRQPPERGEFDAPMALCHLFGRDSLGTSAAAATRLLPGRSA